METTAQTTKRLYKSRRKRMIDGICGGVAEYFDVDPTIVRILWVLITLLGGSGFVLYIAAMIIMPVNPDHLGTVQAVAPANGRSDRKRFWGVLLILLGAFILMSNVGLLAPFAWWHLSWSIIFPIILIIIGAAFIFFRSRQSQATVISTPDLSNAAGPTAQPPPKELRKSITDRKLFGVCGGIAKYFDVDPTVVRILYVLFVFASLGWGLLIYILLAILMTEEKPAATT